MKRTIEHSVKREAHRLYCIQDSFLFTERSLRTGVEVAADRRPKYVCSAESSNIFWGVPAKFRLPAVGCGRAPAQISVY